MTKVTVEEKVDTKVVITAIISLSIMEIIALLNGFNGQLLRWCFVIIAGLGGLILPTPKILRRK